VALTAFDYDPGTRRATVRFAAALADGRYRLTIAQDALPGMAGPFEMEFFILAGDANHDGQIDADDYFQIDLGYASGKSGFGNGDFDYNGVVDADDYFLIDQNFSKGSAALMAANWAELPTLPVIEPSTSMYRRLLDSDLQPGETPLL
jgi:hypothetical protein